jgi:UDP-glucose 4-epimerase
MKILVTGGNGFVGRALCERLVAGGESVVVVDNCRYGTSRLGALEARGLRFRIADIRSLPDLESIIAEEDPEVIIHLAALHYIPECEGQPGLACDINVTGTVNLLRTCPEGCHFVFTSSGAVYAPEESPHREDVSPTNPLDVYGFTKLHGEQLVDHFARKRNFPATLIRLFNVVGEGETSPHFIPEIIAQLQAGRRSISAGTLSTKRDYIDVRDVAEAFHRLATLRHPAGASVVNLGTGILHSGHEVMELIRLASGYPFEVLFDPTRVRKVDRPNLFADTSKLRALVGWVPTTSLEQSLRRTWANPVLPSSLIEKYKLS